MSNIQAVKNHVLFRFVDAVNSKGQFEETTTAGGLYVAGSFDRSAKIPRWADIISVGPGCEYLHEGDRVLIPSLRWTEGSKLGDAFIWRTDETEVVGVLRGDVFTPINLFVIFNQADSMVTSTSSGLVVISNHATDTPHGDVVMMSTKCEDELQNSTIYYDGANFFNQFKLGDVEYAFIKQDDILAYS